MKTRSGEGIRRNLVFALAAGLLVALCLVPAAWAGAQEGEPARTADVLYDAEGRVVQDAEGRRIHYEQRAGTLPRAFESEAPAVAGPQRIVRKAGLNVTFDWLWAVYGISIGVDGLQVADLDGDGSLEVVAEGTAGSDFWYVMQHEAGNYPKVWVSFPPYTWITTLRTHDLDGDGDDEVLVGVGTEILVYEGLDPVLIRTIPTAASFIRNLRVADVDGDTDLELVFCDNSNVYIYDYASGALEEAVPGGSIDVAIGQVDADPGLEIVVGGMFGADGMVLDGATRALEWYNFDGFGNLTRTGDLDGDGMDEIVAGYGTIVVYDADTQSQAYSIPIVDLGAVQVVDVENDGPLEIVYGDAQWGDIHVVNGATGVEKWQVPNPDHGTTDVAVADVDGDGTRELLWGAGHTSSGPDHLYVVDTVTQATEWQNDDLDGPFYGFAWGDVDGDSQTELLHTAAESGGGNDAGSYLVHDAVSKAEEYRSGEINPTDLGDVWRIARAQVDADPQEEIFVTTAAGYTGWVVAYDGLTHAQEWQATGSPGDPFRGLQVADVDSDGSLEVVAVGTHVFVYAAATGALEWQGPDLVSEHRYLRLANVDGDANLEILAARDGAGLVIYDGVTHAQQLAVGGTVSALETEDVDGDGVAEVFLGTTAGDLQRIDPATGTVLETIGSYGSRIDGLAVVDLALDNVEDFVFCAADSVMIADGLDGSLLYSGSDIGNWVGRYDSLRVGDPDGDGKLEIVVNLGVMGVLLQEIEVVSLYPPVVTIDAPADGSGFVAGAVVSFSGTATDPEDGDLSAAIAWSSSRDGALGSGATLDVSTLSVGVHTITATATDSTPLAGSDQILVTINAAGPAPQPFTPGNILVSVDFSKEVREYTPGGALVQTLDAMPHPSGQVQRDLVLDENGLLHVYNGTSSPLLSTYTTVWGSRAFAGWNTSNNVSYGGIAAKGGYVFATDMDVSDAQGIVRFDTAGGPTIRFAETQEYIDLTIGLDCKLYALRRNGTDGNTVDVFDAQTLAPLATVTLAQFVRAIAVSAGGEIFAVSWGGFFYRFDAAGNQLASLSSGLGNLVDVNLNDNGELVASNWNAAVLQTTTAFASVSTPFTAGSSTVFVAWIGGEHRATCAPCGDAWPLAAGQWKMISLPCDVGGSDSVQEVFGDDLDPVDYGDRWGLFARDEVGGVYNLLDLADLLAAGEGYWIKTLDSGQTATVEGAVPSTVDVPLFADPVAGLQNLVGHPFDFDVCWADVEVMDGASVLTLDQADPLIGPLRACEMVPPDPSCVLSRVAAKWNGAAYDAFDGVTTNMQGTLVPFDGLWVEAFKPGVALRIPATPGSGCTFCAPQPVADAGPDATICQGDSVTLGTPAQAGHTYSWSPGGATTAQITVSPAATTTYTVTVTTACGTTQDSVQVTVNLPGSGGFYETFEGDVSGWTTSGLWHRTTSTTCFTPTAGYWSPFRAFYYGQDATCNYDTGARTLGSLTSPPVDVDATSELSFFFLRNAETGGSYDRTDIEVVDAGVADYLGSITTNATSWAQISPPVSLAAWAGKSIRIRFSFDSVDTIANSTPGWLIDDVTVTAASGCSSPFLGPVRRASGVPRKSLGDWWVALGVQSADLNDPRNVLGQLADALDGKDYHDLPEMAPFGDRYLSIVYPHDDWGVYAGDYASDFRAPHPTGAGEWRFDVIAGGLTTPVTLRWTSHGIALDRMALVDEATGERVAATPDGSYTFTMADGRSSFRWVVDACTGDPAAGDGDSDGLCGDVDNCPATANPDQSEGDGDGVGDACDLCWGDDASGDGDGDGACADVDCDDADASVRGACVAVPIFRDGFESGDLSQWSSAVGGG